MLYYPKIPSSKGCPGGRCIAFEKYDGTNLHFDWHQDFGWHSFGTRRDAFNLDPRGIAAFHAAHPGLDGVAALFRSISGDIIDRLPHSSEWRVFAEFLGDQSFAGAHVDGDTKRLVLFDVVNLEAADFMIMDPFEFDTTFKGASYAARIVFRGKFSGRLTEDVRRGKFDVEEGVVIKGGSGPKLWMAKVKTDAYLERLKAAKGDRWEDFWE
jgi:hypothetical protein